MKLVKWTFTFYRFFILGKNIWTVYLIAAVVIVWLAIAAQLQTRGPSLACYMYTVASHQWVQNSYKSSYQKHWKGPRTWYLYV